MHWFFRALVWNEECYSVHTLTLTLKYPGLVTLTNFFCTVWSAVLQCVIIERLPIWTRFCSSDVVFDPIKNTVPLGGLQGNFQRPPSCSSRGLPQRCSKTLLSIVWKYWFSIFQSGFGSSRNIYLLFTKISMNPSFVFPQRITQMIMVLNSYYGHYLASRHLHHSFGRSQEAVTT